MDQIEFIARQMERINDKLDSIAENAVAYRVAFDTHAKIEEEWREEVKTSMDSTNGRLGEYNHQLCEHIRRTEILEGKTEKLEKHVTSEVAKVSYRAFVIKRVSVVIGIVAAVASMAWTVIQALDWIITKF